MKKDIIYFDHDCNARRDPKCIALIADYGLEGYGKFWVLVEMLREQEGSIELSKNNLRAISLELHLSTNDAEKFINDLVSEYELFSIADDNILYSKRLNSSIDHLNSIREKKKIAAEKRWSKKPENADAYKNELKTQEPECTCNADAYENGTFDMQTKQNKTKQKETIQNNSKEKKINNSGGSGSLKEAEEKTQTTTTTNFLEDEFKEDTELLKMINSSFETIWNKLPNEAQLNKLVLLAQDDRFTHEEILEILKTSFTEIYEIDDPVRRNFAYLSSKFERKKTDFYNKKQKSEQKKLENLRLEKIYKEGEKHKAEVIQGADEQEEDLSSLLSETVSNFENPLKKVLKEILPGTLPKEKRITKSREELDRQFQEALKNSKQEVAN